jgi:acetyltransferase-like isoleucine patch superfamily enzyme
LTFKEIIYSNPIVEWLLWLHNRQRVLRLNKNKNLVIRKKAFISPECKIGVYNVINGGARLRNVQLGDFSYVGTENKISNTTIGKFCCIGPQVLMGLGMHPTNTFVSSHPIFYSTAKQSGITFSDKHYFNEHKVTTIGNDVWIGARSIVLDGVNIGNGAIIAAGSIVTKDVPPYSIVGGVPAKLIRWRFTESEIDSIENSKWWDKDITWLKANFKTFHDVTTFRNI